MLQRWSDLRKEKKRRRSRPVLSVMSPGVCLVQSKYHHHHIEYNLLSPKHIHVAKKNNNQSYISFINLP
jgi:hypothetical protein